MIAATPSLTTLPAVGAAVNISPPHQHSSSMSAHDSPPSSATESEASTKSPRLLDSDPSKFRSLKRVIVIGRPGSGTNGVGDALKKLGFKVYDFQTASSRYERDFPLWLEAARLRQEGRPYSKSDFDKLIGDHDAIVGAPACFFDVEFVKLYPGVKVILVTRDSDPQFIQKLLEKVKSRFWQWVDTAYFGTLERFLVLNSVLDAGACTNNNKTIREAIREKNLLEICNLIAWAPLCEFLGVKVPNAPAPELHDSTTRVELATRLQRWVLEMAKTTSHSVVAVLTYSLTMTLATLLPLPTAVFQLTIFLLASSQVHDVTRSLAAGLACCTLVCGFVAGYTLALTRTPKATTVDSPVHSHQRWNNSGHGRGRHGRGRQMERNEKVRPERPRLAEWSGVQDNIRKDDVEMARGGRATLEEWRNGQHVTFHVTHKRTGAGQNWYSGPRKVLSVDQETL
ncbi:hypothetical protein SVAN01_08682 [Stagonosporopsis vannaccii]|nr:hypothetical protein SVAN01_08682 [Stagonosporopsis vannaccii]